MGLTWMKMDIGIDLLEGIPGMVMEPAGMSRWELQRPASSFYGHRDDDKGIDRLCEYVARCATPSATTSPSRSTTSATSASSR